AHWFSPHFGRDAEPIFITEPGVITRLRSAFCNRRRAGSVSANGCRIGIRHERRPRMFRKLTLALVATAAVGTAPLAPSTASATWWGHGHYYGKYYSGYPYWSYSYPYYAYEPGYYHKRYFYGPRFFFGKYGWNRGYRHYY